MAKESCNDDEKNVDQQGDSEFDTEKHKQGIWVGRNVLVTGATGFVGSWITEALVKRQANVTILVRDFHPQLISKLIPEIYSSLKNVVKGDLTEYATLKRIITKYQVDTCFHLAAQTIVGTAIMSPLSTFESNIKGTWNLLEACRDSETIERVVVASSDKAYGDPVELPTTENSPLNALYPYDASKACVDIIARAYSRSYGLPVAVTRCSNIYGGRDLNFSRIVPGTIRSVLLNENPVIRSDGTPVRDYMYVSDAVDAYLTLAEKMKRAEVRGQAFNFGTNSPISVLELVEKIIKITGRALEPLVLGKKAKEINVQYLDSKKAETILNWKARVSLDEGLKKTITWYEERLKWLKVR